MVRCTATEFSVPVVGEKRMQERGWVKAIGKKPREDIGDCPTVPQELLELIRTRLGKRDDIAGQLSPSTPPGQDHAQSLRATATGLH
jgi:hypothetical protein